MTNSIRAELERFQDFYNADQATHIDIFSLRDEWIIAAFKDLRDRAASWVRRRGAPIMADSENIVRSRGRDYHADPNSQNQLELEAAVQNSNTARETADGTLDRIMNMSF